MHDRPDLDSARVQLSVIRRCESSTVSTQFVSIASPVTDAPVWNGSSRTTDVRLLEIRVIAQQSVLLKDPPSSSARGPSLRIVESLACTRSRALRSLLHDAAACGQRRCIELAHIDCIGLASRAPIALGRYVMCGDGPLALNSLTRTLSAKMLRT
jgi:hypothetical protein